MKSYQRVLVIAVALLLQEGFAAAQSTSSFAPFEAWKTAVEAGQEVALAKLYSVNPPAVAVVGQEKAANLSAELNFWAGLKSAGFEDFDSKVLEITSAPPRERLLLRIEAVRASASRQRMAASMLQIWAHEAGGWKIVATQRSEFASASVRSLPEPLKTNPALYAAPAEARAEITAASTQAAKEHKRVLLIFGANWCYDCHVLDATFRSKEFAAIVKANYVVVHINIGDEGKDNNDLAKQFGVGLDRGIPSLAVLDPDGKVVTAQKNGEFESTVRIGPADVRAFLERWKLHS
jgi:thioredoxin 1